MKTITVAELTESRAVTTLTGDRPTWQDGTGRSFVIASGAQTPDWPGPDVLALVSDAPDAPIPQAADATTDAPLVVVTGMDGRAALAAMGLVTVETGEG